MEELETSPRGVSPEPEPAPPVAATSAGTAGVETPVAEEPAPEAPEPGTTGQQTCPTGRALSVDELMATGEVPFDDTPAPVSQEDSQIRAILEAIVYVAEE